MDWFKIISMVCLLSVGSCKHVPKVEPGSISLHLSGETAEVMRKVMGHTAVAPSRYVTIYLIKASEVTPYLECHEGFHMTVQAVRYDNDWEWQKAYFGESVRSAWVSIQEDFMHDPGRYVTLVMLIVRNTMDYKALLEPEKDRLLHMAYWNNRLEKEARDACEHLRE